MIAKFENMNGISCYFLKLSTLLLSAKRNCLIELLGRSGARSLLGAPSVHKE